MRHPFQFAVLSLSLALGACNGNGDNDESITSVVPDSLQPASRFTVVDTVRGNWKVASKDPNYAGFSVQITKDSLIWQNTPIKTLRPDAKGRRFYAHGGRMGLTDGLSASDSVLFEYFKRGDTLWMEYQLVSKDADGKLDRTSWLTHALLLPK